jgi:uncharacterized protein (DUF2236 family)
MPPTNAPITPHTLVMQCHRDAVRARLARSEQVRAGRGSISWRLNREVVVVAGWGRAILLQLAHPSVAAGVHQHSSFRGGMGSGFQRLRSTISAMLAITFGDTEDVINAAAGINAIHDRVRGHVPPIDEFHQATEKPYSAHDPGLQRWVHATLLESIPLTYEHLVGPIAPHERDRYCLEAAIMEPLLGIPSGRLPRNTAQLDVYMRDMLDSGGLIVTDTSRALARAMLYPPKWYLLWPLFRVVQLLTIGTLPAPIREAYGFDWRLRDQRALARWTRFVRMLRRMVPPFVREWPIARRNATDDSRQVSQLKKVKIGG